MIGSVLRGAGLSASGPSGRRRETSFAQSPGTTDALTAARASARGGSGAPLSQCRTHLLGNSAAREASDAPRLRVAVVALLLPPPLGPARTPEKPEHASTSRPARLIDVIAAHRDFRCPAEFTRALRTAYGTTPRTHRHAAPHQQPSRPPGGPAGSVPPPTPSPGAGIAPRPAADQ
ncbi:hypothetical protein [Streptomyces fumanus]|uniref:Uncharacterized protein n=1 Tax=Streptomyces fumanus TaxID=67302 RepID=A0A919A939_9ACTN|nr:hypothetical protein [Streptomyces fumanus]GHE92502.1 hypothetical protein GCM10018772_15210 [Streptomyces fumanus]